jgi:hypothetical protein
LGIKPSFYTVLFDACVLYPAPLRDILVQLATTSLFRAKWTNHIHDEWINSVLESRPDLNRQQLERTRDIMNGAILDCLITNYEYLIPALDLPDPDDRHVLAAAIHARCDAIITTNLKDFPAHILGKHNIEALHPDDFIHHQFGLDQAAVITSAYEVRARLKNPPVTADEYIGILRELPLPKTASELLPFKSLI